MNGSISSCVIGLQLLMSESVGDLDKVPAVEPDTCSMMQFTNEPSTFSGDVSGFSFPAEIGTKGLWSVESKSHSQNVFLLCPGACQRLILYLCVSALGVHHSAIWRQMPLASNSRNLWE